MGINTIGGTCDCRCEGCVCCDGPEEFDIEITLTDVAGANGCNNCDTDMSGTYTLAKVDPSTVDGRCVWELGVIPNYDGGSPCNNWVYVYGCEPTPTGNYVIGWGVSVEISCYSDTQYKVEVLFNSTRRRVDNPLAVPCATFHEESVTWRWERIVNIADFNCNTVSAWAISRSSVTASWYAWCDTDDTLRADAILTAV